MTRGAWLVLVVALLGAGCDDDVWRTSHGGVDEGNEALSTGQPEAALAHYREAAAEVPESPALSYDRGLALSVAGRHDEATQMLLRALDARDPALRHDVYAALGAAYARWALEIEQGGVAAAREEGEDQAAAPADPMEAAMPKWERAVEHLEKALLLERGDEDVLRNLEIALLRVDPPCSARNDDLEPNDGPDEAALVEPAPEQPAPQSGAPAQPPGPEAGDRLTWSHELRSCPEDEDWFRVELGAGDRLAARIDFPDDGGRLALSLWAPDGERRLRPPADAEVHLEALEFTVGPEDAGPWLLRVENLEHDEVVYDLEVVVRPPCSATEDRFEDNDGPEEAVPVTPGPLPGLRLCPLDEDWYAVTLAEGESLFAFATLQEPQGEGDEEEGEEPQGPPPLELEVQGPDGTVSEGAPTGQGRVSTLLTPGEGRYLIRVSGPPELEARYQLLVQIVPPCPEGDDQLEDNDIPEDAPDFEEAARQAAGPQQGGPPGGLGGPVAGQQQGPPPPMLLRICPGDVDWLEVTAKPEEPAVLSAVFEHAKGDLAMTLFDEAGDEEIASADASSPEANGESLPLPQVEEPTPYTVRVEGREGAENFYLLRLDRPQGGGGGEGEEQEEQDDQQKQDDQQEQDDQQDDQQEQDDQQGDQEQQDRQDPRQPRQDQAQERATPLEDALDKLDRNPENLEARERARRSPLVNHPPEKDW